MKGRFKAIYFNCNENICRSIFSFQNEVINYSGDLTTSPLEAKKVAKTNFVGKKGMKGRGKKNDDYSSDENDW